MKLSRKTWSLIVAIPGTIIVLGYLFFYISQYSNSDNSLICKDLIVEFDDKEKIYLINAEEVIKIIENAGLHPVGVVYRKIKTDKIEKLLRKNPMIRLVESYKTPSGIVKVKLTQRVPKFIVAGVENFYVDNDKRFFPVSLNHAVYVPVVSGRVTQSFATNELFEFIDFLEKNAFWSAQIEQIFVKDDLRIELIPRVGNGVILLGKIENYEKKLSNLEKLYKHGFNKMGWDKYSSINLEYQGQIVCKRIPKSNLPLSVTNNENAIMHNDSIELRNL